MEKNKIEEYCKEVLKILTDKKAMQKNAIYHLITQESNLSYYQIDNALKILRKEKKIGIYISMYVLKEHDNEKLIIRKVYWQTK